MTLDTRAHRAAQGIRNAVEAMEMSTSTKEPRTVERFDRFWDRKQRNRRIGALVVVAMLVIATVVLATNALDRGDKVPVTHPSQNGRIVFGEGDGHDSTHLFTMNPDGNDVRSLSIKTNCMLWTPDGSKILIDRQTVGGLVVGGLATINPDGTGYTELSQHGVGCGAFSPDGTRFLTSLGKGIYTAWASDGGDLVRLTNFGGMYPSYSPDGTQVVFTPPHDRAHLLSHHASGLWVVNADGTGLHRVAHMYAVRPTWSPDGQSILFSGGTANSLYVVRSDGTGLRRITLVSVPRLRQAFYPSWSPDGTRFVFVGMLSGSDQENLFTAQADGTDVQQITHTRGISYLFPDWGTNTG